MIVAARSHAHFRPPSLQVRLVRMRLKLSTLGNAQSSTAILDVPRPLANDLISPTHVELAVGHVCWASRSFRYRMTTADPDNRSASYSTNAAATSNEQGWPNHRARGRVARASPEPTHLQPLTVPADGLKHIIARHSWSNWADSGCAQPYDPSNPSNSHLSSTHRYQSKVRVELQHNVNKRIAA
jgi:hypothetical protein